MHIVQDNFNMGDFYGITVWTLTKRIEKKLDGIYTRMLQAIFNKYWKHHFTNQHLYGH